MWGCPAVWLHRQELGHKQDAPRLALGIVRILIGATLALEIIIDVGNSSILVELSQIYHSTIGRVRDIVVETCPQHPPHTTIHIMNTNIIHSYLFGLIRQIPN